jgi:hypothetical protein
MSGLIQETLIGFSPVRQADLVTAATSFIRFKKLNASLTDVDLLTESDKDWIGKPHEFAETNFITAWDVQGQLEKLNGAEWTAIAFAFALGKVVTTGAGPYIHTITPLDVVADGIDLPAFSLVEQHRPGGSSIIDRLLLGCCVEDVTLTVQSGPSLATSKCVVNFVGTGKKTEPSAVTLPAAIVENLLRSASLSLSANGTDYVSTKKIIELTLQWKNNIRRDTGYFPGSDFQTTGDPTTGAVRGRMEHGTRELTMSFVARFDHTSTELATLQAQSSGTVVIGLAGAGTTAFQATLQKTNFAKVKIDNAAGIVSAQTDVLPMYHATNGLITCVAHNAIALIG